MSTYRPNIPLEEAAEYFLKLKYGSAQGPQESAADVLSMWDSLPNAEKEKIAEDLPSLEEYLAQEEQAKAEAGAGEQEFLRGKMQQMQQEAQAAQQQAQSTQSQMEQLNQQLAASTQQIQSAQQQTVTAQQMAQQAQQSQLQSADQALRTQQLATQMREAYQQLRGQLLDLASQDPAAASGAELSGQAMDPMGGPMGAPGSPTAEMAANAIPTQEGDAPPQANAAVDQTAAEGAMPAQQQSDKMASAASIGGSIAGAGLGGILMAGEAATGTAPLKERLQRLEGSKGGFGNAVQQAATKAMIAYREAAEKHPVAATGVGMLAGGLMGGAAGEDFATLMSRGR